MSQSFKSILLAAVMMALGSSMLYGQKTPADVRVVTDENRASIEAAMPSKLLAPVKKPRRILVYSRSIGFYHKATPLGKVFFENVQKKFKGYRFVMSDEPKDYTPENLKKYDALIFNNGTKVEKLLVDAETQKGIIQFVKAGGGIMCIHAGSDGGWPEYSEMIGSRFAGHPWTAGGTHSFLNENASHGMTKQFGSAFQFKDEIYISKEYFDREKFRVLVSMDFSDKETASKPGGKARRHDKDYSVSHVRAFGSGRVFYTSFGHTDIAYFDNKVLTHYLAGIQYVAGDLKVEDKPIVFYDRLKTHDGPLFYEAKEKLLNMIRYADTAEKKEANTAIYTKLIKDSSATAASRQLAIEALSLSPTPESLQIVAGVLKDKSIQHAALLFVSEHANDAAFKDISEDIWGKLDDDGKVAVITAMGARGSAFADKLLDLTKKGSLPLRAAAVKALGHSGEKKHAEKLLKISSSELAEARDAAVVDIAGRLSSSEACSVYEGLLEKSKSIYVKQASLIGLVRSSPSKGKALVLRYLSGSDDSMKQAAIMASAAVPGEAMTVKLGELAERETRDNTVKMISTLALRDDSKVIATLEKFLAVPAVKLETINLISAVGGAKHVPALAALASGTDKDAEKAAVDALISLRAKGVDEAIAELLNKGPDKYHLAVLKICDDRRTPILARAAVKFLSSENSKIAAAALKVVVLGGEAKEFDALCALGHKDSKNARLSGSIAKLGARLGDDDATVATLINHADRATPEAKALFVKSLGEFPVPESEKYLLSQLSGQTAETELAAVKALAGWGNSSSLKALIGACENGQTEAIKTLAFKSVTEMTASDRKVAPVVRLHELSTLLKKAETDSQLVYVLNALAKVPDPGVENAAKAYYGHSGKEVADAARAAVEDSAELMSKVDWVFSSNFNNDPDSHKMMVDMDPKTRWGSRAYMYKSEEMWIIVDLGYEQAVTSVVLDAAPSNGDFPRKYELYVSNKPDNFGAPAASGNGAALTDIKCSATGRYVKIVQTGKDGPWWSIHELKINGRPKK